MMFQLVNILTMYLTSVFQFARSFEENVIFSATKAPRLTHGNVVYFKCIAGFYSIKIYI
jgi:hypothetical protein